VAGLIRFDALPIPRTRDLERLSGSARLWSLTVGSNGVAGLEQDEGRKQTPDRPADLG
jgi:hypothetical protein